MLMLAHQATGLLSCSNLLQEQAKGFSLQSLTQNNCFIKVKSELAPCPCEG
jgi:hypothetical protein